MLLERSKLLVEGAGAVGVAALLTRKVGGTGSVCALLSGGNIDPTLLLSVLRHGLTVAGRYLVLRSRLADRPGELIRFLGIVADTRANIVAIEHRREGVALEVADTGIELTVVTRNEAALPAPDRRARGRRLSRSSASELRAKLATGRSVFHTAADHRRASKPWRASRLAASVARAPLAQIE